MFLRKGVLKIALRHRGSPVNLLRIFRIPFPRNTSGWLLLPIILVRLTGEFKHHLNTRIEEHLGKDKKSHIYSHLQQNPHCQEKVNFDVLKL